MHDLSYLLYFVVRLKMINLKDIKLKMSFYITTAIAYTNGNPHMGHAYEIICADIIARYQKLCQKTVYFATGTDNHGKKISDTAKAQNVTPLALCDHYSEVFKKLYDILGIEYDYFVRTTDENHKTVARLVWSTMMERGDIYLGEYNGWYNVREEEFVNEREAQKCHYVDVSTGKPLTKHVEPSYYFRLSQYQKQIICHIEEHEDFIYPLERREEILTRLKEPLNDLSISRSKESVDWGIQIPNTEDVMYVWVDALTNYLTAIQHDTDLWPADVQLIGKDIVWFHAVIWSGILLSLRIPLPKTILVHGFVNGSDHRKMSKSFDNAIDPFELLDKYNPDIIRCYLASNIGPDICVGDSIQEFHNLVVAKFSNLVNRCLVLSSKFDHDEGFVLELFSIVRLREKVHANMNSYQLKNVLDLIFEKLDVINLFITKLKPWEKQDYSESVIKTALKAIGILSHFLDPFMPTTAQQLRNFLKIQLIPLDEISWHQKTTYNHHILFHHIGKTRIEKKLH